MKKTTHHGRTAVSALAGLTMVAAMTAAPALASENAQEKAATPDGTETQDRSAAAKSTQVTDVKAEGLFSFNQTTLTSNEDIATFFKRAVKALCGSTPDLVADNPLGWQLSVSGEVSDAFTESVGELAGEESVNRVMTCTCGGNPAGGRAIITADVKGIPIDRLLARAGAAPGANTLTFVASDGTEMKFPLGYVVGRHAVLSYQINGEDLSASAGGNNQLWMTKTPASYFLRDVVRIVVSTEDVVPAVPGATDEHPNSPNVGVLTGTQG